MTNDCLVTKLKGVVQNDNLKKMGEVRFTFDQYQGEETAGIILVIDAGTHPFKVEALDGGYILDNTMHNPQPVSVLEHTGRFWIQIPNQPKFRLIITSKYELTELSFSSDTNAGKERSRATEVEQFDYMVDCVNLNLGIDLLGDFTKIFTENSQLSTFAVRSYSLNSLEITGDFDKMPLAACVNTLNSFSSSWSAGITGNITYFAPFINLTNLSLMATAVTGTLEALADAMAVNRKSGSLLVYGQYTSLTYQGEPFSALTITFTESGYTISTPS